MLKKLVAIALCLLACGVQNATAQEAYPSRTVELVVPYGPGGSTDGLARVISNPLSEILKVPVVVLNKPGAAGLIGLKYVLDSADGYRIAVAGNSNMGTGLTTSQKMPYSLDDISGLALAAIHPLVVVTAAGKYQNMQDLLNKTHGAGKDITYASTGNRSPAHFYGELLGLTTKTKVRHIPYTSGANQLVAAVSGEVDIAIVTLVTGKPMIEAGKLTALMVGTESRLQELKSVPTANELGYPALTYSSFEGYVTGSKVPKDRLEVLRKAIATVLNDPKVQADLKNLGAVPSYKSGADYDAFLRNNLGVLKGITSRVKMEE